MTDDVPETLIVAVKHLYDTIPGRTGLPPSRIRREIVNRCVAHFGVPADQVVANVLFGGDAGRFIDFSEILVEVGQENFRVFSGQRHTFVLPIPAIGSTLNDLFERHRFGFRIEDGNARRLTSPLLEQEVVGPSLFAAKRAGWDKVDDDYREALIHQRGGEIGLAMNSAHAAAESALKALGFKGASLSDLMREFRKSDIARPYLSSGLDQLMGVISKLTPLRGEGEAH